MRQDSETRAAGRNGHENLNRATLLLRFKQWQNQPTIPSLVSKPESSNGWMVDTGCYIGVCTGHPSIQGRSGGSWAAVRRFPEVSNGWMVEPPPHIGNLTDHPSILGGRPATGRWVAGVHRRLQNPGGTNYHLEESRPGGRSEPANGRTSRPRAGPVLAGIGGSRVYSQHSGLHDPRG
jgi:hypothetical protein